MMFNVPLPGGTSGHAVGVAAATIVLGPWGSIPAISVALVIQALFFGDGGVTAIGANCFNMAIVGSFVASAVYVAAAGRAPLASSRRVVAAALAGYVAVNAAALATAVELGLQPLLYHDASGAPLYCPYPLGIAVPAMMIGHLTVAGLAEAFVTGGIVAFLQRSEPDLLRATARAAPGGPAAGRASLRPLWAALGVLLVVTPLGLLAAGTAWGEWSAREFTEPARRQAIQSASRGQAPPARAPEGLARLSSVWTAPWPDYAPPFVRSSGFGYALSGMFGAGLAILAAAGLAGLARARRPRGPLDAGGAGR